ncbi:MAG: methyltransferase domain-containing protein [Victivallaceae bacterium]|jgi:SAM-dependent methyltransferase
MLNKLKKYLFRRKTPVLFEDALRTGPISAFMGTERGTPVDRYYIEQFLEKNKHYIKGTVLEIAESVYSRKLDSGVIGFEVLHAASDNPEATIVGDLTDSSTLPDARIDCFICTQTFNFIFDVQAAVKGACKLLKPGGVMLGTVAGISQISRFDMDRWGDYWRFTDLSVKKLLEAEFSKIEMETFGNILAAKAFLDGVVIEDLPNKSLLDINDENYQLIIAFKAEK